MLRVSIFITLCVLGYSAYRYYIAYEAEYQMKYAREHFARGDYYRALIGVGSVLRADIKHGEAFLMGAQIHINERNDCKEGLFFLARAFKYIDKPTAQMFYLRGKCHFKSQAYSKAVKDLEKAQKQGCKADDLAYYLEIVKNNLAK